jgi:hypothetical protein
MYLLQRQPSPRAAASLTVAELFEALGSAAATARGRPGATMGVRENQSELSREQRLRHKRAFARNRASASTRLDAAVRRDVQLNKRAGSASQFTKSDRTTPKEACLAAAPRERLHLLRWQLPRQSIWTGTGGARLQDCHLCREQYVRPLS